ncbi:MAG: hypothetical protein KGK00_14395 [Paracoccaceae bacterium]|nr:hypothetical protein [Paracoccaceae bacterium]MDE3240007.1 hypothetical protein [Paracoccaceae bacterium]
MQFIRIGVVLALVVSLGGCFENDTQRGVVGAVAGGAIAGATGGDVATGAIIGGAAGVFCRDLNVPGCRH